MAKIRVSMLEQLDASSIKEETSLLAVDSQQSYQLRYGFLSSNLSSSLYRPLAETVSAECGIQQQKDDILSVSAKCENLCSEIQLSANELGDRIADVSNKLNKISVATSSDLGLVKLGFETDNSNKNYGLSTDQDGNAYVHVPWTGGGGSSDPEITSKVANLANMSSFYAYDAGNSKVADISTYVEAISADIHDEYGISARLNEAEDDINDVTDFIDDIFNRVSGLYNVGCVYTTTCSDIETVIRYLSKLITTPSDDDDIPSKWISIDTVLSSNGIYMLKRIS